jgi:hypothetical protein
MMRIKLVVSVLGVAFTAVTVFSSDALAKTVKVFPSFKEFSTGRILVPGDPLVLKASDLLITTTEGNIACEDGRMTATLQNNGLRTDGFLVTGASFHNAGNGPCPSTTPLGAATITTAPPKGGWPGLAKARNGIAKVTGPLILTATFKPQPLLSVTCTWSATRVKATFIPNGQPIEVRVSDAKFKRLGTEAACSKSVFLSADYNLTTQEPVSSKQVAVSMS